MCNRDRVRCQVSLVDDEARIHTWAGSLCLVPLLSGGIPVGIGIQRDLGLAANRCPGLDGYRGLVF